MTNATVYVAVAYGTGNNSLRLTISSDTEIFSKDCKNFEELEHDLVKAHAVRGCWLDDIRGYILNGIAWSSPDTIAATPEQVPGMKFRHVA